MEKERYKIIIELKGEEISMTGGPQLYLDMVALGMDFDEMETQLTLEHEIRDLILDFVKRDGHSEAEIRKLKDA